MKIGSVRLDGELLLAPMANYTNIAFRTICRKYGASLVFTELVSAKAICMKNKQTMKLLSYSMEEKPIGLQLFGNNPKDFSKAISFVEKNFDFDLYDLNAGCSVPKAFKGSYGVSLMNDPKLIGEIISSMKSSTQKPITLKMRLGVSQEKETFLEVAKQAENVGASLITLHARFGVDGYSKKADWGKIKLLKQNCKVPVVANGDINSWEKVLQVKKETNCDFEMIGRGAIGNAFLFTQAKAALLGKRIPKRTKENIVKEFEEYIELARVYKLSPNDVRPNLIGFAKSQFGAAKLRDAISKTKTIQEMQCILEKFFDSINC